MSRGMLSATGRTTSALDPLWVNFPIWSGWAAGSKNTLECIKIEN